MLQCCSSWCRSAVQVHYIRFRCMLHFHKAAKVQCVKLSQANGLNELHCISIHLCLSATRYACEFLC